MLRLSYEINHLQFLQDYIKIAPIGMTRADKKDGGGCMSEVDDLEAERIKKQKKLLLEILNLIRNGSLGPASLRHLADQYKEIYHNLGESVGDLPSAGEIEEAVKKAELKYMHNQQGSSATVSAEEKSAAEVALNARILLSDIDQFYGRLYAGMSQEEKLEHQEMVKSIDLEQGLTPEQQDKFAAFYANKDCVGLAREMLDLHRRTDLQLEGMKQASGHIPPEAREEFEENRQRLKDEKKLSARQLLGAKFILAREAGRGNAQAAALVEAIEPVIEDQRKKEQAEKMVKASVAVRMGEVSTKKDEVSTQIEVVSVKKDAFLVEKESISLENIAATTKQEQQKQKMRAIEALFDDPTEDCLVSKPSSTSHVNSSKKPTLPSR